ncbi:MAG TPA: hypothetical protein VG734_21190 [Lacunisphaera sp.]|nr:hypothetical protein [Lacunisphaera sp.]
MNATDYTQLNGRNVLVKSTADRRDPPIALRGTIEARPENAGGAAVRIVLEFPDMCNRAAHQRVIVLDDAGIEQLLASEHDGVFEYTIDRPLDDYT